jgi:hypothetical protein
MNPARGIAASGVADTGWYRDRIGSVDFAYVHGRMTEASFEHFLAEACRSIDECGDDERIAMFLEVLEPALMDSRWRKRMAEALKQRAAKLARTRPAYVMVTPSLVVRTALKVVQWAAPPPHPHSVVSSLEEGFEFIARHVPGLDAAALQSEYERRRAIYLATRGRG